MIISSDWGAREELAFSGEILSKTLLMTYVMVTPLMVNVLVTYMYTIVFLAVTDPVKSIVSTRNSEHK